MPCWVIPVKISQALQGVKILFLDTAPVIYFIESNPIYREKVSQVFRVADENEVTFVTSPITLAECLVIPYRQGLEQLRQDFIDLITGGEQTIFVPISAEVGQRAAQLRAEYGFALPDALQVAVALMTNCDAFLTNDRRLARVQQLRALVISDLELDSQEEATV